jgi:hypothetical protein
LKWVGRSGTILLFAAIALGIIGWRVQAHRRNK